MSTTLIHHSPLGALEIVGVPGAIQPGEPFTVSDEHAEALLAQTDLYALAPAGEPSIAELRTQLKEMGLPSTGKRDELLARLAEHATTTDTPPSEGDSE